jgi:hypothetical protein
VVAYTRAHQLRNVGTADLLAAAERFLDPGFVASRRTLIEPTLSSYDPYRDLRITKERQRKGVAAAPRSVDEWKSTLPESYAEVLAAGQRRFAIAILGEMKGVLEPDAPLHRYRNVEELKAWVAAVELAAETRLELRRDGQLASAWSVAGYLDPAAHSRLARAPVAFRASDGSAVAVLALRPTGDSPDERARFFLVTGGEAR